MNALLNAALKYLEYGWAVVPLHSVSEGVCSCRDGAECGRNTGKHPRIKGWRQWENLPTAEAIRGWWEQWPGANVGITTGHLSGVVAIDIDDPNGFMQLQAEHGTLPDTAVIETGNGEHLLFRSPAASLPNSVKKLAPGIDVRGEGGLIVAPPSLHYSGKRYEWAVKLRPAALPSWVPELLKQSKLEQQPEVVKDKTTPYGQAVLNGELAKVVQAPSGAHNDTLFQSAVRVYELVKAGHIDRVSATEALMRAAMPRAPQHEAESTLRSAWNRAEARGPKAVSEQPDPTVAKFLTIADLRAISHPRWLVPYVLPEGLTVLYGRYGGGKTFVALDIALTLAAHGGLVIYCAGEGVTGLSSRVDAWTLAHPDLDPSQGFRVLAHGHFPRLLRPASVQQLLSGVERLEKAPVLFVLDTWRRALAGSTVSADDAATGAIDVLDTLRDRWGTSSLVLHHPRRSSREEPEPPEAGSGAVKDNADFVWKLTYPGHDHTTERTMWNEKAKEWEEQSPLRFLLRESGDSLVTTPSVSDLMEPESDSAAQAAEQTPWGGAGLRSAPA